jgi:hypothetical protein
LLLSFIVLILKPGMFFSGGVKTRAVLLLQVKLHPDSFDITPLLFELKAHFLISHTLPLLQSSPKPSFFVTFVSSKRNFPFFEHFNPCSLFDLMMDCKFTKIDKDKSERRKSEAH